MDNWHWQLILTILCVAWSATWIVRRCLRFVSRPSTTCGAACTSCPSDKQERLVHITTIVHDNDAKQAR